MINWWRRPPDQLPRWIQEEPFFRWFHRPYWPARWFNRLMPAVLIVWWGLEFAAFDQVARAFRQLIPGGYWIFILFPSPELLWIAGDEVLSRLPANEARRPAFFSRMKTLLWPLRPRRRLNQVMLVFLPLWFETIAVLTWLFGDHFINIPGGLVVSVHRLILDSLAIGWLLYILTRWMRTLALRVPFPGSPVLHALLSILYGFWVVVMITAENTDPSPWFYVPFGLWGLLAGAIWIADELRTKSDQVESLSSSSDAGSLPNWW